MFEDHKWLQFQLLFLETKDPFDNGFIKNKTK